MRAVTSSRPQITKKCNPIERLSFFLSAVSLSPSLFYSWSHARFKVRVESWKKRGTSVEFPRLNNGDPVRLRPIVAFCSCATCWLSLNPRKLFFSFSYNSGATESFNHSYIFNELQMHSVDMCVQRSPETLCYTCGSHLKSWGPVSKLRSVYTCSVITTSNRIGIPFELKTKKKWSLLNLTLCFSCTCQTRKRSKFTRNSWILTAQSQWGRTQQP